CPRGSRGSSSRIGPHPGRTVVPCSQLQSEDRMSATVQIPFDVRVPRTATLLRREALWHVYAAPPGVQRAAGEERLPARDACLERAQVPRALRNSSSALEDPEGIGPRLFFQQVPEGKTVKNRVHLDVRTASHLHGDERMAALEERCAQLVALGGTRLGRHEPDG